MIALAVFLGLPVAGFALGIGLGAGHAFSPLVAEWFDRRFIIDEPDSVFDADQTNLVHGDFRPGRWPVSTGGDAA